MSKKKSKWTVIELIDDPLCKVYQVTFDSDEMLAPESLFVVVDSEGDLFFLEPIEQLLTRKEASER